ncbi:MAG TPA: anti-sigma factor antagonist [Chitinivibrionales bacterium]|jgi:anti-sigma B factor antagonist
MSLRIKIKNHGNVPVLRLEGEVVGQEVAKISKKLDAFLKTDDPVIAVDLSAATIIDSYGLGVFVFTWKQIASQNRQLVFVNPQGFIRNLFDGTNLTKVIRVVGSLEEL